MSSTNCFETLNSFNRLRWPKLESSLHKANSYDTINTCQNLYVERMQPIQFNDLQSNVSVNK